MVSADEPASAEIKNRVKLEKTAQTLLVVLQKIIKYKTFMHIKLFYAHNIRLCFFRRHH